jgi:hypothetical protein
MMSASIRRTVVSLAATAALVVPGGIVASPSASAEVAPQSGHSTQSHNGLTCNNWWGNTAGGTNCSGARNVKWRLRVRCAYQGDYTGSWQYGRGNDSFECNFRVQSASVEWG